MSKKPAKPIRQQASPKPKKSAYGPSKWLERPTTATDKDGFYEKIFTGLSLAILLITIVLALGSGINGDDEYQNDYSTKLVSYYSTMGADSSALNIDKGKMHYYGGFFDIVTGFTNKALGLTWQDAGYHSVRHIFNAIFGVLAMLFTALLAKEIAGWRAAILTLLFMFLSPRFLGDSLMNPKDIPFAAGYAIALYFMALFFKQMPAPQWKTVLGIVLGMALAIATRAGGLLLVAFLFLFAGLDFLMKNGISGLTSDSKTVGKYAAWTFGIAIAGYVLALLFWPFAMQSPISNPLEALGEFSKLGVKIRVLFAGENVMSDETPWNYALQWIWRTIPLFSLIGLLGGLVFLGNFFKKYQPLPVFMAVFAALFPLFYIIYKDSILHDGWRHLTFVYPTMTVVAALFYLEMEAKLKENKIGKYLIYGVVGLMMLEPAVFIARNAKFPYVYFNPLAGGISGAFGNYETDYWGVSMKQAVDWLEAEGKISPTMKDTVTIGTSFSYVAHAYVDKKFNGKVQVTYVKFASRYEKAWDYGIFPSRYIKGPHLHSGAWPNKRTLHTITANGIPLTAIEQGGGAVFEGEKALKAQDFQGAVTAFQQETQQYPDNEQAWLKMAMAYLNLGNPAEAKNAASKAIEAVPGDTSGLFYKGLAGLYGGDLAGAALDFQAAIKLDADIAPNIKNAYERLAQSYDQQGNAATAQQVREAAKNL
ncbi:MAG: tetratricopeptide repeat protein [Saprospiraceae bacterium]|nr:tetratricopeptide repeat protein [Saprospiraceae bacterium]MCF8248892.1 tetratricopeptide repeat protein [Saprospiraceae bacterium]MCF8279617.1 tetratricopeptide repeat protein [Bacteroidales bacterium]MCF8310177.1 tetratricopeptide repeat protein [Saprospiraceae bacterium]MCF8439077.1 tetratricopeptide repeat protein [Saprospiraceae bacterium]